MSRVPGIAAIYAVMVIACGGVGLFMLIAPASSAIRPMNALCCSLRWAQEWGQELQSR